MPQATNYDAIVIGTSQGAKFLPIALAKTGRKVALIERDRLGGVCVNVGCTPTKTMVASARLAYLARSGADYGVHTGPISVDMRVVRQRKQGMVEGARLTFENRIKGVQGLDLLEGLAHFLAPKTLEVTLTGGQTLSITAPMIFLETGDPPEQLAIKGVESVSVLNSTTIMELDTLPEHLLIISGGSIGLEFGQMFRRFGSQVTIIQRSPRLLMREDEDVSEEITKILREDGITVLTATTPQQIEKLGSGRIQLAVVVLAERRVEVCGLVAVVRIAGGVGAGASRWWRLASWSCLGTLNILAADRLGFLCIALRPLMTQWPRFDPSARYSWRWCRFLVLAA